MLLVTNIVQLIGGFKMNIQVRSIDDWMEFKKCTEQKEALLEACRLAYDELGKDQWWNISDLRLKVLGQAIANATK